MIEILRKSVLGMGTVIGFLMAITGPALAVPAGPMYPAPGGNNWAPSGGSSAGDLGGIDFNYSNFDSGAFSELYWGPNSNLLPSAALDGSSDPHTSYAVNGTTAQWIGTTTYDDPTDGLGNPFSAQWVLNVDISGLGANPWVKASDLGLPDFGYVVDNSAGLDFTANLRFLADVGAGHIAINDVLQPAGSSNLTKSDFYGAFYAVPVPSTMMFFGVGFVAFGLWRYRFEKDLLT